MGEQIKVTIDRDGTLVLTVGDTTGPQCLALTASFEKEMGRVLDRQRTRDFYRRGRLRTRAMTRTKTPW